MLHRILHAIPKEIRQRIPQRIRQSVVFIATAVSTLLTACENRPSPFAFSSPQEAVNACHYELSKIKPLETADMKSLTKIVRTWMELQDSVVSCLMRDSVTVSDMEFGTVNGMDFDAESYTEKSADFIEEFFTVADSFRTEITRLALAEKRTLPEVVELKVATSARQELIASENYKKADAFFEELDRQQLIPDLETMLSKYEKILIKSEPFRKEQQLLEFMKKEDQCFRSLMLNLDLVSNEELQDITDKTSELFDNLYRDVASNLDNSDNERIMIYLTMRFNRRIIQNANACRADIKARTKLDEQQASNYRWMLIQPLMSIDTHAMAVLTERQVKDMLVLAEELPGLMLSLDGMDYKDATEEEKERISSVLSDYILKSYLRTSL